MRNRLFSIALVVVSIPLLIDSVATFVKVVDNPNPAIAVVVVGSAIIAVLFLVAGISALRHNRAPDMRLLIASLMVSTANVLLWKFAVG